jgi:hypothetical protein
LYDAADIGSHGERRRKRVYATAPTALLVVVGSAMPLVPLVVTMPRVIMAIRSVVIMRSSANRGTVMALRHNDATRYASDQCG